MGRGKKEQTERAKENERNRQRKPGLVPLSAFILPKVKCSIHKNVLGINTSNRC